MFVEIFKNMGVLFKKVLKGLIKDVIYNNGVIKVIFLVGLKIGKSNWVDIEFSLMDNRKKIFIYF